MPNQEAVALVVRAGFGLIVLLLLARFALMPLLADVFRQRVFKLRRELFMNRVRGAVTPELSAYRILMGRMNAVIRRAESLSFGRLLTVASVSRPSEMYDVDPLERALADLPEETRKLIEETHKRLSIEIARHVVLTSPLAWLLIVLLLPVVWLLPMISAARRLFGLLLEKLAARPSIRRFENDAAELEYDEAAVAA